MKFARVEVSPTSFLFDPARKACFVATDLDGKAMDEAAREIAESCVASGRTGWIVRTITTKKNEFSRSYEDEDEDNAVLQEHLKYYDATHLYVMFDNDDDAMMFTLAYP